ncbi:Ca-activated chloride channel family protein [Hypnocyclicus thermotrophus]|uniref:Ca-activated chloride channel family protein n=1 Tax=Hypnocyclicus thermotrophus TaxID=1627895 RepID=A0AA46I5Y4_9FUSO|nr:VWA domain-containing protein [Hypnocyclicus thermotrophus]TDT71847.1 Ca-activated chloride channel family protein [Hypnocyclicus thermotrophus]
MDFVNKKLIYLIILNILIIIIYYIGSRKKINAKKKLNLNTDIFLEIFKGILYLIILNLIVVSLMQPRKFKKEVTIKSKSNNIFFLIDISKSMLSRDIFPNRLEVEKSIIKKIIENLSGEKIAFIPFSSGAYIQMPLTNDYDMAKMFLDIIDSDLISSGGTDIKDALNLIKNKITNKNDIIIILSDGGDEKIDIKKDYNIFSIGIGSEKGGTIPNIINGEESGFIKDKNGNIVISKLNKENLKKISKQYFEYYDIQNIISKIKNMKKQDREDKIRYYKEYYQYFLGSALLLLLIIYIIEYRRKV